MLPHVSMRCCFKSPVSRRFHGSYLKANKVSKIGGTRKVEHAYNFRKCADAVYPKLSKSVDEWWNYSLQKLARFLRWCITIFLCYCFRIIVLTSKHATKTLRHATSAGDVTSWNSKWKTFTTADCCRRRRVWTCRTAEVRRPSSVLGWCWVRSPYSEQSTFVRAQLRRSPWTARWIPPPVIYATHKSTQTVHTPPSAKCYLGFESRFPD